MLTAFHIAVMFTFFGQAGFFFGFGLLTTVVVVRLNRSGFMDHYWSLWSCCNPDFCRSWSPLEKTKCRTSWICRKLLLKMGY